MWHACSPLIFQFISCHDSAVIATPVELLKSASSGLFLSSFSVHSHLLNTHLVVKLQLQSQKAVVDRQFKGPIDCARQIIRMQGILGMWSGFTGSLAFRANFFWMFFSVEVPSYLNEATDTPH